MSHVARTRPYPCCDVAITICSSCHRKLEGKIVFEEGSVFRLKRCPDQGAEKVLIADAGSLACPIRHFMLNTNGVRIAEDEELARRPSSGSGTWVGFAI